MKRTLGLSMYGEEIGRSFYIWKGRYNMKSQSIYSLSGPMRR